MKPHIRLCHGLWTCEGTVRGKFTVQGWGHTPRQAYANCMHLIDHNGSRMKSWGLV